MPVSGYFDTPFAVDGDLTPVPDAVQPSGSISYTQGWGPYYAQDPTINPATALFIDRAQTNQIFNDVTSALQQMQQFSAPPFITTAMNGGTPFSYTAGARVVQAGAIYQSNVNSNTDTPPSSKWTLQPGSSGVLFTGGTSGGSANTQTVTSAQGGFTNTAGNIITWLPGFSNSGSMTLNADSLGAVTVKKNTPTGLVVLSAGDVVVNEPAMAISDGTELVLINPVFSPNTFAPVVTSATGLKCSVTSANSSATFSADEVVTKTALGGTPLTLSSFSQTVNLSTTGAGGMDTGAPPNNGFVALYAIAKADGTKNILACNVSTSSGPVYSGGNMPATYIYSALIGIWPTNSSGQFPVGYQGGRTLSFPSVNVLNIAAGSTSLTYASVGLSSAVPPSARMISGMIGGQSGGQDVTLAVAGDANGSGEQLCMMSDSTSTPLDSFTNGCSFLLQLVTAQTMYYKSAETSSSARVNITSYTF